MSKNIRNDFDEENESVRRDRKRDKFSEKEMRRNARREKSRNATNWQEE